MISTSGMCFEASAAKRIASTAPIAKFGTTRTFASPPLAASRSGVVVEARGADDDVRAGVDRGADVVRARRRAS